VAVTVAPFTLGIGPASGSRPVQTIDDYDSWTLDNNLDDGCAVTFSSRGRSYAATLISELDTDVFVFRGGTLVQRFRIVSVEQTWEEDGQDEIQVVAVCYRRLLKSRHVLTPLSFVNVPQGDIVWGLIQHAQAQDNGDLGITAGSLESTVLRSREYEIGQNIFDAISDLTKVDAGIAWDIDAQLVLDVRLQNDYPFIPTPIELGVTARSLSRPSSADQFGNVAIVTGDVQATDPVVLETAGLTGDIRGRWERYTSVGGESDQIALIERALGVLQESLSPVAVWTVGMVTDRYFLDLELEIGQFVPIVQPRTIVFQQTPADVVLVQIIERNITQTADGDLEVLLAAVERGEQDQRWGEITPTLEWQNLSVELQWRSLITVAL
jgi:hypothetical protein